MRSGTSTSEINPQIVALSQPRGYLRSVVHLILEAKEQWFPSIGGNQVTHQKPLILHTGSKNKISAKLRDAASFSSDAGERRLQPTLNTDAIQMILSMK
jgi:hypothetical protein